VNGVFNFPAAGELGVAWLKGRENLNYFPFISVGSSCERKPFFLVLGQHSFEKKLVSFQGSKNMTVFELGIILS
jgi:hypothetical protein